MFECLNYSNKLPWVWMFEFPCRFRRETSETVRFKEIVWAQKHQWSSGRIHRCHRCDPGSIPGWCTVSLSHVAALSLHPFFVSGFARLATDLFLIRSAKLTFVKSLRPVWREHLHLWSQSVVCKCKHNRCCQRWSTTRSALRAPSYRPFLNPLRQTHICEVIETCAKGTLTLVKSKFCL